MRAFRSMMIPAAVTLLLAACAMPQPPGGRRLEQEVAQLQQSQTELARRVDEMQATLGQVEARLQDQQSLLEQLRTAPEPGRAPAGRPEVVVPPPVVPRAPAGQDLSPTEVYRQSFADYASGRYAQAVTGFGTFLQRFPDSGYAGNAQYWLGESYFAMQEYARAVAAFQKVVEEYPKGGKAPESLYKMALAYQQLNRPELARKTIQLLRERYPDSPAAGKSLEGPGL